MMGSLGMGFGILSLVLMILFWAGMIALAIWLIRVLFPSTTWPPVATSDRSPRARELLDRRFARGEISREEYDLIRERITDETG